MSIDPETYDEEPGFFHDADGHDPECRWPRYDCICEPLQPFDRREEAEGER
jgi:hypothetical protein